MNLDQYDWKLLQRAFSALGIEIQTRQIEQFMQYYAFLIEWNGFMNLTAITEFDDVCIKHFVDSVSLCRAMDCSKEQTLIDIGTGAGFPGIPLKIIFPNLTITLLDSLGKRVKFLNTVIENLGLEQIDAIHGRAEDFAKPDLLREKFDVCVSRAVANLSTLSEYCLPYVKNGGYFVSYKSEKVSEEIQTAKKAIALLGGEVFHQEEFTLPCSDIYRNLFVIRKVNNTPKKYPRKAGLPTREPLK